MIQRFWYNRIFIQLFTLIPILSTLYFKKKTLYIRIEKALENISNCEYFTQFIVTE